MSIDSDQNRDPYSRSAKRKSSRMRSYLLAGVSFVVVLTTIIWLFQNRFPAKKDIHSPDARAISARKELELAYEHNEDEKAITLCHQYALLAPEDPFPWLVVAGIHHSRSDRILAIHAYQEALSRKLSTAEAERVQYQLVGLFMDLGDLQNARLKCNELLKTPANSQESAELIALRQADLLRREGHLDLALATVNELLKKTPELKTALSIRGFLLFDLGNDQLAADDLGKVVRKDDFDQPAHYKLGQAFLRMGKLDEARFHLKRSQELIQMDAEIMITNNLLQNDPENRELQRQIARLYEQRGNSQMASRWRKISGDASN